MLGPTYGHVYITWPMLLKMQRGIMYGQTRFVSTKATTLNVALKCG
jgi:hypothetical protein